MADVEDPREHISNPSSLKRRVKALERRSIENEEMRLKYPTQPERFVESEVNLDEEIKLFASLAAFPDLLDHFQESGGLATLVGLLGHANPDIAASVVAILVEIFDPEVINEIDQKDDDASSAKAKLVEYIFEEFDLMALLGSLLDRLNEEASDEDFQAVSNVIQILDHLRELRPDETVEELLKSPKILLWMFHRLEVKDEIVSYNQVFCAELLSSLLQTSSVACEKLGDPARFGGIDKLLVAFSAYKKRDWKTPEEEEFVMNVKNCMMTLLLLPMNRDFFFESQGIHLMVRLMRGGAKIYSVALKVVELALLDHAMNAKALVQANGLGIIFGLLSGKSSRYRPESMERKQELECVLTITCHLAELCTGDEQSRLIFKFFEHNCNKLRLLCTLLTEFYTEELKTQQSFRQEFDWTPMRDYNEKTSVPMDPSMNFSEQDLLDDDVYDERLEMGLLSLQSVCRILLKLTDYGNDILTAQVHALLDAPLGNLNQTLLDGLTYVVREYADHLRSEAVLKTRHFVLNRVYDMAVRHDQYLDRAMSLRQAAVEAGERAAALKEEEEEARKDEERRDRNRRRKVQEKMRKLDRELQRREELEEYRWNRKHGIEM